MIALIMTIRGVLQYKVHIEFKRSANIGTRDTMCPSVTFHSTQTSTSHDLGFIGD